MIFEQLIKKDVEENHHGRLGEDVKISGNN
jgi:hypothetical protein